MIKKAKLKDEIERVRDRLNEKLVSDDITMKYRNEVLCLSQQLDELIIKYMHEENGK